MIVHQITITARATFLQSGVGLRKAGVNTHVVAILIRPYPGTGIIQAALGRWQRNQEKD